MEAKKASMWKNFLQSRQTKQEQEHKAAPDNTFYSFKMEENGATNKLYITDIGCRSRTVLSSFPQPVPHLCIRHEPARRHSLSHSMWGAGTEPNNVRNFGPLEDLIRKSEPGFSVGPKTKQWWERIPANKSFKKVYSSLH